MTAWDVLTANSTAPAGSTAWVHLNSQTGVRLVAPLTGLITASRISGTLAGSAISGSLVGKNGVAGTMAGKTKLSGALVITDLKGTMN